MAALDFPASPTVGQTYPNPAVSGQPVYTWDGEKWTSGSGFGNIYIADTAPNAPVGSLWWESDSGILYVRYADGTSTQWVAMASGPAPPAPRKNYIINGAMMVSQENGTTTGTTDGYYPVDLFRMSFGNAGAQVTGQVAGVTPGGSPNRIIVGCNGADASVGATDNLQIIHIVEGLRAADLMFGTAVAKTITVQFGVKAPAGTYCFTVSNSGNTRNYVSEYVISAGEANTDVMRSITVPGDVTGTWLKDNSIGIVLHWVLMCGTTYQQAAGSWGTVTSGMATANQFNLMGAAGNNFYLFDVSLTEGTVAPPFVVPDYASELAACMRYWEKSYDYSVALGTTSIFAGAAMYYGNNCAPGPTMAFYPYFKTRKRSTPTIVMFSPTTGATGKARDYANGQEMNAVLFQPASETSFCIGATVVTNTTQGGVHWKADARL